MIPCFLPLVNSSLGFFLARELNGNIIQAAKRVVSLFFLEHGTTLQYLWDNLPVSLACLLVPPKGFLTLENHF